MKYLMKIAYDGNDFKGFATQKHKETVQDFLSAKLTKINSDQSVKVLGASRTDKGVHALAQHVMFELIRDISIEDLKYKVNKLCHNKIEIKDLTYILNDKFHVRYSVLNKTYEYKIIFNNNIFLKNNTFFYNFGEEKKLEKQIDVLVNKINIVKNLFIGKHDFQAFSTKSSYKNTIKTINYIDIEKILICGSLGIIIKINGNGFLYNMVRVIIGTIIEFSNNKITKEDILQGFETGVRNPKFKTIGPQGLYLIKINYKE